MIVIFLFSMMPGDESSETSGALLQAILKLVEGVSHKDLSAETMVYLHFLVRKAAHFTEYAVLGATIMYAIWDKLYKKRFAIVLPELIAAVYATTDEVHQYFVPGRYGTWTDVVIDSCGALAGILIFASIYKKNHK